ncbi:MAG: hypothetical protein FWE60_06115 [Oscillospiraceae bacterium]|nr:hypothetical protein [Oscillospiraceae bacterium]
MFITDIAAAVCSAAAFIYTFLYMNFILRLPSRIMDTTALASERNAKLIVFITMVVIMLIILVKFVSSIGKVVYCFAGKGKPGLFTRLYTLSNTMVFRKISVALNGAAAFFVSAMFVLVFPFREYEQQQGRRIVMINAYEHQVWEMRWFFPMLRVFIFLFFAGLVISVIRLKIINVKKEYNEIYAVHATRNIQNTKCRSCGFDNHISSTNCGSCGGALRNI